MATNNKESYYKKRVIKSLGTAMVMSMLSLVMLSFVGCSAKDSIVRAENTEYVILMLTDLHLYVGQRSYVKRVFKTIDRLVAKSNPDFIIVTGDVMNSKENNDEVFRSFAEKMESYKIPWTYSFGNHDVGGSVWSKEDIANYLESLEYCKFEKGPENVYGYGNNYFPITDKNGKIIQTIFTIDTSGTGNPDDEDTHAVDQSQIDWYTDSVREIAILANGNADSPVPSIMFSHIPMSEYREAYDQAIQNNAVVYGKRREKECPASQEDELLETIVRLHSTKAYYCGHEHTNNYVVNKDGIRLSYGETCKHKAYIGGKGGLVINIKNDGTVTQQNIRRSSLSAVFKISKEY